MKAKITLFFKFGSVNEKLTESELYLIDKKGLNAYIENIVSFYGLNIKIVKQICERTYIEDEKFLMIIEDYTNQ